jgi:hypothetical protein
MDTFYHMLNGTIRGVQESPIVKTMIGYLYKYAVETDEESDTPFPQKKLTLMTITVQSRTKHSFDIDYRAAVALIVFFIVLIKLIWYREKRPSREEESVNKKVTIHIPRELPQTNGTGSPEAVSGDNSADAAQHVAERS